MAIIPKEVIESITPEKLYVVTTSSKDDIPNSVYFKCVKCIDNERILLANNKMDKSLKNLLENPNISLLFEDKEKRAYQIKGIAEYFTEGEHFEDVRTWVDERLARKGAVVLNVKEIFSGAERII